AKFGETPMAIVYSAEGVTPEAIVAHCNAELSGFKVPRYIVVENQPLPRLATGKIAKMQLRETYRDADKTLPKVR
ncbi:MAG: hypothetical protein ACPHN3_08795, partial [Spongiibacter sp.]